MGGHEEALGGYAHRVAAIEGELPLSIEVLLALL